MVWSCLSEMREALVGPLVGPTVFLQPEPVEPKGGAGVVILTSWSNADGGRVAFQRDVALLRSVPALCWRHAESVGKTRRQRLAPSVGLDDPVAKSRVFSRDVERGAGADGERYHVTRFSG